MRLDLGRRVRNPWFTLASRMADVTPERRFVPVYDAFRGDRSVPSIRRQVDDVLFDHHRGAYGNMPE